MEKMNMHEVELCFLFSVLHEESLISKKVSLLITNLFPQICGNQYQRIFYVYIYNCFECIV